ncbi:MAG: SAM-dependent DNA methyltransferase, partial [Bacteroidetes bacterium]|nr:SAM-dependent DNA methyltransferase [Bacteroidota bacterium]
MKVTFPVHGSTAYLCISRGRKEKEYLELINKYEKPGPYAISEAIAALLVEMTGDGNGMVDVLGKYFEENLYDDKNRQFLTPQNICDRMARIQNPTQAMECITDPGCGSGRMLMAMAKVNRFANFYGTDKDANCAKTAVINLCLNKMYGE